MEIVHDSVGAAAEVGEGVREVESRVETRAGVMPKWVKVGVVGRVEDEKTYDLLVR